MGQGDAALQAHRLGSQALGRGRRVALQSDGHGHLRSRARGGIAEAGARARRGSCNPPAEETEAAAGGCESQESRLGSTICSSAEEGLMNEFKKDFQDMQCRFSDRTGHRVRDENVYWTPIVVTKREIDAETERLASLPRPANGRRESLIVHPLAEANAPGFAPGIQVKISVLKPGEKTAAFRHNATEVNFCIRGSGHTLVAGKRIAFAQYDVWNHPSYAAYRHVNDGTDLQVRLTYSNVPLLQHMQVYLPEDKPAAGLRPVEDAEERERFGDPRRKSPYGMIRVGADGGMLMPYEILINPEAVVSKPLHFPWKEVKRELDKLEALGKEYAGRRLYMMYNPVTGRTNGITPNFFATR